MAGEQLRVTEGNARGESLSLEGELLIGRAAEGIEGRLGDDPELSRRHAQVSRGPDGQLTIEDLGSANGTFVNDERVEGSRTLRLGDTVRMGQTVLEVTDASGWSPAPTKLGEVSPATPPAPPPPVAVLELQLVVTVGKAEGRRLTPGDEFVIGRATGGEGRLGDDPELSRRHARVTRDAGGRLTIEDLGSANGTFVNDIQVREPRVLQVGDKVRVGMTILEVSDARGPTPAPPAPAAPAPAAPGPPPPAAPSPQAPAAPSPQAPAAPSPQAPAAPGPPAPAPARPPARPPAPGPSAPAPPPPAARPPAARPAPPPMVAPPDALPRGTVIAGCRLEEVIGHGDMGVVYRAEELALQRQVALKLILPEHTEEQRFRERFRRESRVAASIDHPNVIPILEAGDEDGVLFITMRLVEGTDLRAVIGAEGGLDPVRVARIVRQVGAALDAAHARGLVHRDVKPANVLLARGEHVYLSDFGLAKSAEEGGGLTRQGSIVARAEYVAPEQIVDDRVDALTDVYALGCLLFEALTGEPPYVGSKEGPAMLAHVNAPPPVPSERRFDLPPGFDEVVARAMAKDPGQRYPSAGDLGQAALVAAGERRRAGSESVVAAGAAAPYAAMPGLSRAGMTPPELAHPHAPGGRAPEGEPERPAERASTLAWGFALAMLAVLAVGMFAALNALSNL